MVTPAERARVRQLARATHALVAETVDLASSGAIDLAVVADVVGAWIDLEADRPADAVARLDKVVSQGEVEAQWSFLVHAGRGVAHHALDHREEARVDLAAAADVGTDDHLALAACLDLLAELEHLDGDADAAYRHLRSARVNELAARAQERARRRPGGSRPGRSGAPEVVDLTDRRLALEHLVRVREAQLDRALIDLRDANQRNELDPLTGLANRQHLREVLTEIVEAQGHCAVLAVGLDRFSRLNETLGHRVGDEFLVEMSARLQHAVRISDVVARWGGDEFVIVVPGVHEPAAAVGLAEAIRQAVAEPWGAGDGRALTPSVSIGVAVGRQGEVPPDHLLRHADAALEQAKVRGKDRVEVFGEDIGAASQRRFEVERLLRAALDDDLFELYFQPVHANTPGYPLTAEALLRLHHPDGRLLAPGAFLDVAEETGLARPIGSWVLRSACAVASRWAGVGEPFHCAVNVSAHQLDDEFPDLIADTLERQSLDPERLVLELTEHTLLEADAVQVDALDRIRATGVRIALDDFGTAYSSLTHLRRFAVDVVKIDQSFIAGITVNAEDAAIVSAIVELSRTFGFRVVAEGIETVQQLDLQRRLGCHGAQGYLIGRPKPAAAFGELLATRLPLAALSGVA